MAYQEEKLLLSSLNLNTTPWKAVILLNRLQAGLIPNRTSPPHRRLSQADGVRNFQSEVRRRLDPNAPI
jgi:hypothetical protein